MQGTLIIFLSLISVIGMEVIETNAYFWRLSTIICIVAIFIIIEASG